MYELTVIKNNSITKLAFSGTPTVRELLEQNGFAVFSPCGGRGSCGKCAVKLSGEVSLPNQKELKVGHRLACQARLLGDAVAELCVEEDFIIETETTNSLPHIKEQTWKYGAAVDIGTTTIALKLFNGSGALLGDAAALNPQYQHGADVISRIGAALNGKGRELQKLITDKIYELLEYACAKAQIKADEVTEFIITGNTAMLYLLTNRSPESIAVAPFETETHFGEFIEYGEKRIYLPYCMNAFIGGDITCALSASGICNGSDIALLCDIGTNGEIALWKDKTLYVASTAAGPAFEGAMISCGIGSVNGAIDGVRVENGNLVCHIIGGGTAKGICGSGLIDAVAAFLDLKHIDKSGAAQKDLTLCDNIMLQQDDIRALQLAKAAIAAGIETLLSRTNTDINEIKTFYISGGFGNNLPLESASAIGLIPKELLNVAKPIGNAALSGAVDMLFDGAVIEKAESVARKSVHIDLGGSDDFYRSFISNIDF